MSKSQPGTSAANADDNRLSDASYALVILLLPSEFARPPATFSNSPLDNTAQASRASTCASFQSASQWTRDLCNLTWKKHMLDAFQTPRHWLGTKSEIRSSMRSNVCFMPGKSETARDFTESQPKPGQPSTCHTFTNCMHAY